MPSAASGVVDGNEIVTAIITRRELIETPVHGRYLMRPADLGGEAPTLVGFHGYGENAETHLREIGLIPGVTAWNLMAIQALHPFYNTRTGEVVASWMTKSDRESAIEDNIRYVARVLDRELGGSPEGGDVPLVFVGFSQGTAMAYRAAAGVGRRCRAVVALGGDLPAELAGGALSKLPVALIGRGSRDEWYSEEKLGRDIEALVDQGVECRPVRFEGGHEWTDSFRSIVGRFLEGVQEGL